MTTTTTTTEPTSIGRPPRTPRWRPALARRFVLGLLGGILLFDALVIGIVFLFLGYPVLPFDDLALNDRATTTEAVVESVEPTSFRVGSRHAIHVGYRFRSDDGTEHVGASFTFDESFAIGARHPVEYLPEAPDANRLRGTVRVPGGWVPFVLLQIPLMAGVVMLLIYLRGVVQTRILLRDGTAVRAQVVTAKPVRHVNPRRVRVEYRFLAGGLWHDGNHQVGARSPLGRRLLEGATEVDVVHDPFDPKRSRAVAPEDFADA